MNSAGPQHARRVRGNAWRQGPGRAMQFFLWLLSAKHACQSWNAHGNALRQGPGRSTQLCVVVTFQGREMGLCSAARMHGGGHACSAGCCRGLGKAARAQLAGMLGAAVIGRVVCKHMQPPRLTPGVQATDVKLSEQTSVAALCIGQRLQALLPSSTHSHLFDMRTSLRCAVHGQRDMF